MLLRLLPLTGCISSKVWLARSSESAGRHPIAACMVVSTGNVIIATQDKAKIRYAQACVALTNLDDAVCAQMPFRIMFLWRGVVVVVV